MGFDGTLELTLGIEYVIPLWVVSVAQHHAPNHLRANQTILFLHLMLILSQMASRLTLFLAQVTVAYLESELVQNSRENVCLP